MTSHNKTVHVLVHVNVHEYLESKKNV